MNSLQKTGRGTRAEDARLIRGAGCYLGDLLLPGTLEVAFLRSTQAHAKIVGFDPRAALEISGIEAIYRLDDIRKALVRDRLPLQFIGTLPANITPYVLAKDEVVYVGEPIAIVVASTRYLAEDAVSRINVEYEPLPVVVTMRDGLAPNAPLVASDRSSNIVAEVRQSYGDIAAAFANPAGTVQLKLAQHRGAAHPIEGRGALANPDPALRSLMFWSSTQLAHELRSVLMQMLGFDENQVRVLTPDVGGGFGAKYLAYAEEVAIAAAALALKKPLRWVEDRREHFLAALQERDQEWKLEIAYDRTGCLLGARGNLFHDQGAYTPQGINIPYNSATAFPGPYILPAYDLIIHAISTNKVPTSSVRGAGYPQGAFAMERALDSVADKLGISRVDIRRRNLVRPEQMPYSTQLKSRSGSSIIYDSGDFPKILETALDHIGYTDFLERQASLRTEGTNIGLGIACGIKGTGRGPYESGLVRIGSSGRISVYTGASEMGQGIKTTLAEICGREFGIPAEQITVIAGDTATVPIGMGGFASRQIVTAGSSVHLAAGEVRAKVLRIASHLLEAAEEDLEIENGAVSVKGIPEMKLTLREIAAAVYGSPGYSLPKNIGPGLESAATFVPKGLTYGMSCHAVELEIDDVTFAPKIRRYVVINDAGVLVNRTIAEGQIVGGAVHGIGNALYERMIFDSLGQPLTSTLADYLLPTATEVPEISVDLVSYPSTTNPIGVKGIGEAGVVPAAAAIASAIESAIGKPTFRIESIPTSPDQIFSLLQRPGGH